MIISRDLQDLSPEIREKADRFLIGCRIHLGFDVLIYCTYRNMEAQAWLYASGRTRKGTILTNAKPGQSKHNNTEKGKPASKAFDFVPMVSGKPAWDNQELYAKAGKLAESIGLKWAGNWRGKLREMAHCEID